MDETPLETAQRIWPGAWKECGSTIRRRIFPLGSTLPLSVTILDLHGEAGWYGELSYPGTGRRLAEGPLEYVITTARDKVQSMARAFAASAGVT